MVGGDDGGGNEVCEDARERGHRKMVAMERFDDAYRLLSNSNARLAYNAFLEKVSPITFFVEDSPYVFQKTDKMWRKPIKVPKGINQKLETISKLPDSLSGLRSRIVLGGQSALRTAADYPHTGNNAGVAASYKGLKDNIFSSDVMTQTQKKFVALKKMRKIYEATLAVYVRLVGTVDEYAGAPLLDSQIHSYRSTILNAEDAEEHVDRFERWQVVQQETLKRFRDGTMAVYIPLNDSEFDADVYRKALALDEGGCPDFACG